MAKSHFPYAPEYRRQMVELVRSGRTPGELAREFECSASAIRNWVRQADRDEGRREDGLTTAEREELRRLRREVRQLRDYAGSTAGKVHSGAWFVSGACPDDVQAHWLAARTYQAVLDPHALGSLEEYPQRCCRLSGPPIPGPDPAQDGRSAP